MALSSLMTVENTAAHLNTQAQTQAYSHGQFTNSNSNSNSNANTRSDDDICSHLDPQQPKPVITVINDDRTMTESNLELAVDDFNAAQTKDFERILQTHHPNLIQKRDEIYSDARSNHISVNSSDSVRCSVVREIVEWLFNNIEPPDAYTKQTDRTHFDDVGSLATEMYKSLNPDSEMPASLLLSAWFHDIERFIPETKCRYLPESVDHIRKQAIHSLTSARVCEALLRGSPFTESEKDRIFNLIRHHDYPSRDPLIVLDQTLIESVSDDMVEEWEILQSADSLTFFKCTIVAFVEYKSTKNTPIWIWTRVINNISRLRDLLQPVAIEAIMNLSDDIKTKMGFNINDLRLFQK